jgi:hypothetical protein
VPSRARLLAVITALAAASPTTVIAQTTRVDLTGPFLHFGGLVGSINGETAPASESRAGFGWGVGAGMHLNRRSSVVGSYTIFNFREIGAPSQVPMEQAEVGVRVRLGGVETPAVFYLEGGGAWRHTSLTSARAFAAQAPDGAGETVPVDGWAGWFGPGFQVYFGRRLSGEVSVAWAWGEMATARINGTTHTLDAPLAMTTLRMRVGMAATLF